MARRVADLRDDLYERSPESRDRVAQKVSGLEDELGLAELRTRGDRTQAEIAARIGTSQPGVSRIERQDDLLVSTLGQYVRAAGGRLRLIAEYDDHDVELKLAATGEPTRPRVFRVIWQNLRTRQFVHVGRLTHDGQAFGFDYTADARLHDDFRPFRDCPDYDTSYSWPRLPSFLADRLSLGIEDEGPGHAGSGGASAIELLSLGAGATDHDVLQIVPEPEVEDDGSLRWPFLVSGVRHVDEDAPEQVGLLVASLRPGQDLRLEGDVDSPTNDRAIRLTAGDRPVGWIPDHMLDEVHKLWTQADLTVSVVRSQDAPTPWHLRLFCELRIARTAEE